MDMEEMENLWGYHPDIIRSAMAALDWHLGYFEWQGTVEHQRQMAHFAEALQKSKGAGVKANYSYPEALANDEARLIDMAQTCWVQADICTVIEHAVENMPNGVLRETDLPMDHGLMLFSRPLELAYRNTSHTADGGLDMPLRGLAWAKVVRAVGKTDGSPPGDGIYIWLYTDREWSNQTDWESTYDRDGNWVESGTQIRLPGPELMPMDLTAWLFDDEWDNAAQKVNSETLMAVMRPQMVTVRKYLLAMFLYMKEQIIDTSYIRLPRAARRRAQRARFDLPEEGSIKVVHLRKIVRPHTTDAGTGEPKEWTHRWWVRAHWRQIKAKDGKMRLIPIRAHIKGPDDKPLIIKSEIYSVDR